jgi:hypothetical protein
MKFFIHKLQKPAYRRQARMNKFYVRATEERFSRFVGIKFEFLIYRKIKIFTDETIYKIGIK